jgi:hypothetical protein
MKGIILVSFLLLFLLLMCMFFAWYIHLSAESLHTDLVDLRPLIDNDEWQLAELYFDAWSEDFEFIKTRWEILITHDDMRDIEIAMVDLKTALQAMEKYEAIKELNDLKFFLLHIPDTERVDLGNVM